MKLKITTHSFMGSILIRIPFNIEFHLSGKGTEKEPYVLKSLNRDNTDYSIAIYDSEDFFNIGKFNLRMLELNNCKNIKIVDSLFKTVIFNNCESIHALNLMVSKKLSVENSYDINIFNSKISTIKICENSTGLIQNSMIRKITEEAKSKIIIKDLIIKKEKAAFRHENLFFNLLKTND